MPATINAASDYGVRADGSADDTTRLQALAEDASAEASGALIVLPPTGTIRTSAPIEFTGDNIRLVGGGQGDPTGGTVANKATNPVFGGCVFRPLSTFTGDYVLKFWQGGTPVRTLAGCFLSHFSIDGLVLPASVGGIDFQVFSGGMESVNVSRVTGDGFMIKGTGSTNFPDDAFDLRLHAIKADTCAGNGITFAAADSSDCVVIGGKFVGNGGYGINNLSPGQQFIGCHVYFHSGPAAMNTVSRSTVISGMRLSDVDKHGILVVDDSAHSGNILIDGLNARDVGKLTDNTYDLVNYAPSADARGGIFQGIEHLTTQAHRPRYGVNIANTHAISACVLPVGESYISPATSCFGTARVGNSGTTTRNFDALA